MGIDNETRLLFVQPGITAGGDVLDEIVVKERVIIPVINFFPHAHAKIIHNCRRRNYQSPLLIDKRRGEMINSNNCPFCHLLSNLADYLASLYKATWLMAIQTIQGPEASSAEQTGATIR